VACASGRRNGFGIDSSRDIHGLFIIRLCVCSGRITSKLFVFETPCNLFSFLCSKVSNLMLHLQFMVKIKIITQLTPFLGFNWLVCYSRPIYFCLLALLTFFLDLKLSQMNSVYASPTTLNQIGYVWNPHRDGKRITLENFVVGLRDLSALSILLLPLFFTIGLLPQINTLLMHILEQIEMVRVVNILITIQIF
jgi:hypothetical protein